MRTKQSIRCAALIIAALTLGSASATEKLHASTIHDLVQNSNIKEVERLLADSTSKINKRDEKNRTPLEYAISAKGNPVKLTQILVDYGADINLSDKKGRTPLMIATRLNRVNVLSTLLASPKIKINKRDNRGYTALHWAAFRNYIPSLKLLLQAAADPNIRTNQGKTALHLATRHCRLFAVRALLNHGASSFAADARGTTALHLSAKHCPKVLIQTLVENGANVHAIDERGWSPLHHAAKWNQSSAVLGYLLSVDTMPTAKGKKGETPIHLAAGHNTNAAVLAQMLQHRSARRQSDWWKDNAGRTPLHFAARKSKSREVIRLLLSSTLVIWNDLQDYSGETPLHDAALSGNRIAWELLYSEKRLDRYLEDKFGNTAQMVADESLNRCKPHIVFVSGAMEYDLFSPGYSTSKFGPNFAQPYWVYMRGEGIEAEIRPHSHTDKKDMVWFRKIVDREKGFDPVIVVAYSWGAKTALEWIDSLQVPKFKANNSHAFRFGRIILVTIDPVSHGGHDGVPESRSDMRSRGNAMRWINVYTNPLRYNLSDRIAQAGARWQYTPFANTNVMMSKEVHHDDWHSMFHKIYSQLVSEVHKVCGKSFDFPSPLSLKDAQEFEKEKDSCKAYGWIERNSNGWSCLWSR